MTLFESKKHRREALRQEEPDAARVAIVEKRFPYFEKLSADDRRELLGHVNVFLAEKKFEGCAGLEMSDEIRVTIAAQACLLLLHRETDYFPKCDVVLVYPHDYRAKHVERAGGGVVIEREQGRLGESSAAGVVVLSWDAVRGGAVNARDGHNVVLHEFAHQLDQEDGAADGAPVLATRAAYDPWAKVFGGEYEALKADVDEGRDTDIDAYGATNPAEFFAVVTEAFFEKPDRLVASHPALYDQLAAFYRQDPLARLGTSRDAFAFAEVGAERADAGVPSVKETPAAPRAPAITVCDMTAHPRAAHFAKVNDALAGAVRALGCEHAGFVGTLFEQKRPFAWVGEVMTTPREDVVCCVYKLGVFEGVAFWTLLENGTLVTVETSKPRPSVARFHRVWPIHARGEHLFTRWIDAPPVKVYAEHIARAERIASREGSKPVIGDALRVYIAGRLRSIDVRTANTARRASRVARTQWTLAVLAFALAFVALGHFAEWHLIGKVLAQAIIVSAMTGMVVGYTFGHGVASFVARALVASRPVPAKDLLERAGRVDASLADRIAEVLEKRDEDE
jgi:hypothetical protein